MLNAFIKKEIKSKTFNLNSVIHKYVNKSKFIILEDCEETK